MAGGDLGRAISRDMAEHGSGPQRRLGWYNRGRVVLQCVARGLVYLHHCRVRKARLHWPGRSTRTGLLQMRVHHCPPPPQRLLQ